MSIAEMIQRLPREEMNDALQHFLETVWLVNTFVLAVLIPVVVVYCGGLLVYMVALECGRLTPVNPHRCTIVPTRDDLEKLD